jgi:hypothetical protein
MAFLSRFDRMASASHCMRTATHREKREMRRWIWIARHHTTTHHAKSRQLQQHTFSSAVTRQMRVPDRLPRGFTLKAGNSRFRSSAAIPVAHRTRHGYRNAVLRARSQPR